MNLNKKKGQKYNFIYIRESSALRLLMIFFFHCLVFFNGSIKGSLAQVDKKENPVIKKTISSKNQTEKFRPHRILKDKSIKGAEKALLKIWRLVNSDNPGFNPKIARSQYLAWKKSFPKKELLKIYNVEQTKVMLLEAVYLYARIGQARKNFRRSKKIYKKLLANPKKILSLWSKDKVGEVYYQAGINAREGKDLYLAARNFEGAIKYWSENNIQQIKKRVFLTLIDLSEVYESQNRLSGFKKAILTHKKIIAFDAKHKVLGDNEDLFERQKRINSLYKKCLARESDTKLRNEYANSTLDYLKIVFRGYREGFVKDKKIFHDALSQFIEVRKDLGRFNQLLRTLKELEAQNKNLNDFNKKWQHLFFIEKGRLHLDISDYLGANQAFEKAVAFLDRNSFEYLKSIFYVGHTHLLQGNFIRAEKIYQQIIRKILKEGIQFADDYVDPIFPFKVSKYFVYYLIGLTHYLNRDLKGAENYFEQAISPDEKLPSFTTVKARLHLAILKLSGNDQEKSLMLLEKAIKSANRTGKNYLRAICNSADLFAKLKFLEDKKQKYKVRRISRKAKSYIKKDPAFDYLRWGLDLAHAFENRDRVKKFLLPLEKSIKGLFPDFNNKIKNAIYFFYIPPELLENRINSFMDVLLKEKKYQTFIHILEMFRRSRLHTMENDYKSNMFSRAGANKYNDFDAKLEFQRNEQFKYIRGAILSEMNLISRKLPKWQARKKRRNQAKILRVAKKAYLKRRRYIQEMENQKAQQVKTGTTLFGLKENLPVYLKKIPDNYALAYYGVFDKKIHNFILSNKGLYYNSRVRIALPELLEKIHTFRENLLRADADDYKKSARFLYRAIFAGVHRHLIRNKLNTVGVIADRGLGNIPFSALMYSGDKFLIDDFNFFYLNDITNFQETLKSNNNKDLKLAALFNPSLDDHPEDLSYTSTEVDLIQNIQGFFREKFLLDDDSVTRKRVLDALEKSNIWHIALPGTINSTDKSILSFKIAKEEEGDDRLVFRDIVNLKKMSRSLAFFSNVNWVIDKNEPNPGKSSYFLMKGMGELGFTKFVVSLWPSIKNRENIGLIISSFYSRLRRMHPANALRKSLLRVKQRNEHPFYWSSFRLFYSAE